MGKQLKSRFMKDAWIILLVAFAVIVSCKNNPVVKGEDCSVKLPGVEFTKSLNEAKDLSTIENGRLVLKAKAKSDNFNDPDGKLTNSTAQVLLTKVDNGQPFTLTARVTPSFLDLYDAGVLYVYVHQNLWQKFAFEIDENKRTRIVSVRTINTSDDNNHDAVDSASVYMKISSDTKTIGFYYSLDNTKWQLARLYKNDFPPEIWVGLSTQSPVGNGTSSIFEECSLTKTSVKDFRRGI